MVIVDNNVLSALAKIERLPLLPAVFDDIGTVPSVLDELDRAKAEGYDFVSRIDACKSFNGGWLDVVSPTQSELKLEEEIRNGSLSTTDARCLAVAEHRNRSLVTDDRHVGVIGDQRNVDVWDLVLVLKAAIQQDVVSTESECATVITDLHEYDGYRFSTEDEDWLLDSF